MKASVLPEDAAPNSVSSPKGVDNPVDQPSQPVPTHDPDKEEPKGSEKGARHPSRVLRRRLPVPVKSPDDSNDDDDSSSSDSRSERHGPSTDNNSPSTNDKWQTNYETGRQSSGEITPTQPSSYESKAWA